MIKNFNQFLTESVSADDLKVCNQDEFESADSSETGKSVLSFFENDECLLIDANGDKAEYDLYQWILKIANNEEEIAKHFYPSLQSSVISGSMIKQYNNFPGIKKLCLVAVGNSYNEADRNISNEPMIFVPIDFDPQKFLHDTRGRKLKNFGV